MFIIGV